MRGCGVARVEGDGSGQWSSGAGRDEVRQILDESGGRLRGRLDIFLRGGDLREGLVELSGSRGFAGVRRGDEAAGRWINYGGDKIWPLPEGNDDEQHWTGASTPLDDGAYAFSILSQNSRCTVRLEGPPDPPTGLQYTREISIGSDSPEIFFHAITRNITGHSIAWSVQSVSQYDLSDASDPSQYNHDFWAFAPLNPRSSYLNGYHVRDGLANISFSVKDGLFRLNWRYLENEVWLDSTAGWIALVDGATHYAMVEKTRYIEGADYPDKASVIFYKNGPTVQLNAQGMPYLTSKNLKETPYYMEGRT